MITIDELEIRLHGTGLAPGEITFAALEGIAHAMQLLALRVGRRLIGHDGSGRSPAAVERATQLRLRSTAAGSIVLSVAVGENDALGEGLEHRTLDEMFDVFSGISAGQPPAWTTPLLGEAAVSVIDALARTAKRCDLTDVAGRRAPVSFAPGAVSRSVWPVVGPTPARQPGVSVSGRLDLVDFRRSRFRLRDQAGNDIAPDDVTNVSDAAPLIGESVTATGEATIGGRGQIVGLSAAVVVATVLPTWRSVTLAEAVADAGRPLEGGIAGVGHDEVPSSWR